MDGSLFNTASTEDFSHEDFKKTSREIRYSSVAPPLDPKLEASNKVQVYRMIRIDKYLCCTI